MNLIEVAYPDGTLDGAQRQAIATAVVANLLVAPNAPREAVERAGDATHVWFRAGQTWTTGAGPIRRDAGVPVVVTITVPEAWREELSRHAIGAVRAALARHAPGLALAEPSAVWINVVGVRDGSIGMNGKSSTSTDIVRHLTRDIAPPPAAELPEGTLVDPICGMQVRLGPKAITLDDDGQTVAFCATGCRDVYAQDHHLTLGRQATGGERV